MFADAQIIMLVLSKLNISILIIYFDDHLNHVSVELQLQFMVLLIFEEPHGDLLRNDLRSEVKEIDIKELIKSSFYQGD